MTNEPTRLPVERPVRPTRMRRYLAVSLGLLLVAIIAVAVRRSDTSNAEKATPPATPPTGPSPRAAQREDFVGFPREGVMPSEPAVGSIALHVVRTSATGTSFQLSVYRDGRVVWQRDPLFGSAGIPDGADPSKVGYVEQRLTPNGIARLRDAILATGLFAHDLVVQVGRSRNSISSMQLTVGGRRIDVGETDVISLGETKPSGAAKRKATAAIDRLEERLERVWTWLPLSAWAQPEIRAFVPARYVIRNEWEAIDLPSMRAEVRAELVRHPLLLRQGCEVVPTGRAWALLRAFSDAGVQPQSQNFDHIAYLVPQLKHQMVDIDLRPAMPDTTRCT